MDSFGFGVLGTIFSSSGVKNEEPETKQKSTPRADNITDYTPPDIAAFQQTTQQRQQRNTYVDTLLPVKVCQIIDNIDDGNQKFVLYNQPVGGFCVVGRVQSVEKLTSTVHFQLVDETGSIKVNYTHESFGIQSGDYVQVVGSLIILGAGNYYIEAQHVLLYGVDSEAYKNIIKYHNVNVANAAYHIDIAAKLKLQNKLSGKISDLPGQKVDGPNLNDIAAVELGELYAHITDPIEKLVIQYLKSRPDTLAKRSDVITCIGQQYVESVIEAAISKLESEAEIACTKDLLCLPI